LRASVGCQQVAQPLLVDIVIGYAQNAERASLEYLGTSLVTLAPISIVMNAAVELENEAQRGAIEVDDEPGDDLLASELEPQEPTAAEQLPSPRLAMVGVCRKRLASSSLFESMSAQRITHGGRPAI
jgi:hypothetical protein